MDKGFPQIRRTSPLDRLRKMLPAACWLRKTQQEMRCSEDDFLGDGNQIGPSQSCSSTVLSLVPGTLFHLSARCVRACTFVARPHSHTPATRPPAAAADHHNADQQPTHHFGHIAGVVERHESPRLPV